MLTQEMIPSIADQPRTHRIKGIRLHATQNPILQTCGFVKVPPCL